MSKEPWRPEVWISLVDGSVVVEQRWVEAPTFCWAYVGPVAQKHGFTPGRWMIGDTAEIVRNDEIFDFRRMEVEAEAYNRGADNARKEFLDKQAEEAPGDL